MAKKTKKHKSRRATSAALVRVTPRRPAKIEVLPPAGANGYVVAADGSLQLGALGLVELKLTDHEERVLSERVNPDDVLWKPSRRDGPPDIPYLPHHIYTRWFNRAFGRTGWNLVPVGKPVKDENNVVLLPYVLHVHKHPVAFAWGEQEYFPQKADGTSNRAQTYGDVIESTVGSGLRRCAKHLGVGLEMWDKVWLVQLAKPGQEQRPQPQPRPQQQHKRRHSNGAKPPAPVEHADIDSKISDDKRLRLWNISRRCGRGDQEVQTWLKRRFKLATSSDITNRQYDGIVSAIEGKGQLPAREPGEDA